jgi:hypothetical protein
MPVTHPAYGNAQKAAIPNTRKNNHMHHSEIFFGHIIGTLSFGRF